MRPRLIAAAACALVIATASAVSARCETSDRSPIGVRMAAYKPSDSLLGDVGSARRGPVVGYNRRFDRRYGPEVNTWPTWFGEDKGIDKGGFLPLTAASMERCRGEEQETFWFVGGGAAVCFVGCRQVMAVDPMSYSLVKEQEHRGRLQCSWRM